MEIDGFMLFGLMSMLPRKRRHRGRLRIRSRNGSWRVGVELVGYVEIRLI